MKLKLPNFNILIPMAGEGDRFKHSGYILPKPLIEINNKPMIQIVVDSLNLDANYIYVVRKEHFEKYNLENYLNSLTPGCKIITVDYLTEGAVCTTLLAKDYINNDNPLIISNSDQYIEWNASNFYNNLIEFNPDGTILTFNSTSIKCSFAKLNQFDEVIETTEKIPISNHASCGIYYFKHGSDYVKYSEQMISKNIRINNEFYIAPVYNQFISDGKRIKIFDVDKMFMLGTPEDLELFKNNN